MWYTRKLAVHHFAYGACNQTGRGTVVYTSMSKEEARMTIDKVDQMRENYVNDQARTSRYDTRNYQLVLSMDEISEDAAVEVILTYIRNMEV